MALPLPINLKPFLRQALLPYATCWTIERTDGVVLHGTNHNSNLSVAGVTYLASNALTVSALAKRENLNTRDRDFTAVLDDDRITHDDLRAGKYRQAKVLQYLVNWRYPWAGFFETTVYWITGTTFTDTHWEATAEGLTKFLQPEMGRTYTRDEELAHLVGLPDARGDLSVWKVSGTVQAVTGLANFGSGNEPIDGRRVIRLSVSKHETIANSVAKYYDNGVLYVTSGLNNATQIDIVTTKIITVFSTTFDLHIKLAQELPLTCAISDTVELLAGYTGAFSDARDKFSNPSGFRGFPYIPGNDSLMRTPNAK